MISDLSSTTLLAVFVIALAAGGLICGAYMLVAVWRDDPIFARPELARTDAEIASQLLARMVGRAIDGHGIIVTDGVTEFAFPARPLPTPPRRPFDHDRDRWEW